MRGTVLKIGGCFVVLAVAVMLVLGSVFWWRSPDPEQLFWQSFANNLSTAGVTRHVSQQQADGSIDQYVQLSFGAQASAHSLTIIKEHTGGSITTEEYSTPEADYVRFADINTGQTTDRDKLKAVVGQWANLDGDATLSSSLSVGLFRKSVFGIVPIANLPPASRTKLMNYLRNNRVFAVDFSNVKQRSKNGHSVYVYSVELQPVAYLAFMQYFAKLVGLPALDTTDPEVYAGQESVPLTIMVDTQSATLVEVDEPASKHIEAYEGFGVQSAMQPPHTALTAADLRRRLANL